MFCALVNVIKKIVTGNPFNFALNENQNQTHKSLLKKYS